MGYEEESYIGIRVLVNEIGGIRPGHLSRSSQPVTPMMRTCTVPNKSAAQANSP
jgi:hypothetical protein